MVAGISGADCGWTATGSGWLDPPKPQFDMLPPAQPASASADATHAAGGANRPKVPIGPLLRTHPGPGSAFDAWFPSVRPDHQPNSTHRRYAAGAIMDAKRRHRTTRRPNAGPRAT